mmetsp:Transcript_15267/g.38857  ORF Transcript_15267/g.38857 Transcript_15267/m.38857 type:complete len:100 (-) Transcript_15267:1778-2077(-)|eukprot:CAMPEP_0177655410 /NCGR_PEP_ID=MMETSP0447-20121125/14952_1 /TAXON_ID=0 /ORGANISM="Stygamoeba regulata, Strain BSH-02190019" /LENGTH=99 /DNA_ID=CAMNT_0019159327 /DNA_START=201 /DNA_END=500 /DNA_ORIENTATION=+
MSGEAPAPAAAPIADKPEVDLEKLSPEEREHFEKYGKLPNKKALLRRRVANNRKTFDSADYFLAAEQAKDDGKPRSPGGPRPVPAHLAKKTGLPPHMRQ